MPYIYKHKDLEKVPFQKNRKNCQANGFIEIIGIQTFCTNFCIKTCNVVIFDTKFKMILTQYNWTL